MVMSLPQDIEVIAHLDARLEVPDTFLQKMTIRRVRASILQRLRAEWWLVKKAMSTDVILYFGNMPPLFKLRGWAIVFLQNRYVVEDVSMSGFSLKSKLMLMVERVLALLQNGKC